MHMFYWHFYKKNGLNDTKDHITTSGVNLSLKRHIDQAKANKSFHFGTTGKIHSLGYGPKYSINPKTNLSIDKFATKKMASDETDDSRRIFLENRIFNIMKNCLEKLKKVLGELKKNVLESGLKRQCCLFKLSENIVR